MAEQTHPMSARGAAAIDFSQQATEVERRAFRKVAFRLLPILTTAYVLNYLDRSNIGFAALTMNKELGLTATQFGWGAGILFLGYCFFEIPSNLALYRFGARLWISRIMISWGIISAATMFAAGPLSFYLLRFLLGVAEAGFFPGIAFYLAMWFPAQYRARILAWFLVAIPASSLIGGPVSGALLQMHGIAGLAGWKWLFLVEGIPSVLLGFWLLRQLTDRPEEADWLTEEERRAVIARIAAEPREREVKRLWPAIKDVRVLILAGVMLGFTIGSYAIGIWLPLIIKGEKFSNLSVGLLAAIPYLFACIGSILWAGLVDRSGKKIGNLALACLLSALGLVLAVLSGSAFPVSLLGITVALVSITSTRAIFWTVPPRFLSGVAAAGGLAFINSIGTTGGFIGPFLMGWLKDHTGSFSAGLMVIAGVLFAATLCAISLKLVVRQE